MDVDAKHSEKEPKTSKKKKIPTAKKGCFVVDGA